VGGGFVHNRAGHPARKTAKGSKVKKNPKRQQKEKVGKESIGCRVKQRVVKRSKLRATGKRQSGGLGVVVPWGVRQNVIQNGGVGKGKMCRPHG